MRPVKKSLPPYTTINCYQEARSYLIDNIGEYCSYCERKIQANLAVEHVKPKTLYSHLELDWNNLILACTNCNSTKGHTDVNLDDYYWPHLDNTLIPFIYTKSGRIKVNNTLTVDKKDKAENLIKLVGLNKKPKKQDKTVSNRLWNNRLEVWSIAEGTRKSFDALDDISKNLFREIIVNLAFSSGFFSIWVAFFRDDEQIVTQIIAKYKGTAIDYANLYLERIDCRTL